jgi:hypothetical protein
VPYASLPTPNPFGNMTGGVPALGLAGAITGLGTANAASKFFTGSSLLEHAKTAYKGGGGLDLASLNPSSAASMGGALPYAGEPMAATALGDSATANFMNMTPSSAASMGGGALPPASTPSLWLPGATEAGVMGMPGGLSAGGSLAGEPMAATALQGGATAGAGSASMSPFMAYAGPAAIALAGAAAIAKVKAKKKQRKASGRAHFEKMMPTWLSIMENDPDQMAATIGQGNTGLYKALKAAAEGGDSLDGIPNPVTPAQREAFTTLEPRLKQAASDRIDYENSLVPEEYQRRNPYRDAGTPATKFGPKQVGQLTSGRSISAAPVELDELGMPIVGRRSGWQRPQLALGFGIGDDVGGI